jgi:rod shape-determining protein MreD
LKPGQRMIRLYIKNILFFFTAILIQVLLLDNIQLGGYLNPYFYIIFILLLPFETPRMLLLFSAFLLGFSVDLFNGTPGIHAASSVFMAFVRPFALKNFSPRDGYESGTFPRAHYYGFEWFAKYTVFLVLSHHFFLFFIEAFHLSDLFFTLGRIILSTILTSLIIVLSQFFIFRR